MTNNRLVQKKQISVYARTLFDAAYAEQKLESVLNVRVRLQELCRALRSDSQIAQTIQDSALSDAQKMQLVASIFGSTPADTLLKDVLGVMAQRDELALCPAVQQAFEQLIVLELKLCVVSVTSAVALDDHLRELITNKVEADLCMRVVLDERVDRSLLGGIILSAQGKCIDASVKSRLEIYRDQLKRA